MPDIFSKRKRSEVMSKVSQKDTSLEIVVRKLLFKNGFRFRKNYSKLPGSPDIVLPKYKVVIFIHGCFWHGHICKAGRLPKTNIEFWAEKINNNKKRDRKKKYQLQKLGWRVISIWQCKLMSKKKLNKSFNQLLQKLRTEE